jgi:hypothetical protein
VIGIRYRANSFLHYASTTFYPERTKIGDVPQFPAEDLFETRNCSWKIGVRPQFSSPLLKDELIANEEIQQGAHPDCRKVRQHVIEVQADNQ